MVALIPEKSAIFMCKGVYFFHEVGPPLESLRCFLSMRDSYPKKNKYCIPRTVWFRVLWLLRDRDRMEQEADDLIKISTRPVDAISSSGGVHSDPVYRAVAKREHFLKEVDVIDQTLKEVPAEYRSGVWDSIQGRPYPMNADRTTYSRWKSRYIRDVAVKMGFM